MEKTVPTRAPEALTGLPALEIEIRTMIFLANSHLEPECSDSLWDREIAASRRCAQKGLGVSLPGAAVGADLGGSSKFYNILE